MHVTALSTGRLVTSDVCGAAARTSWLGAAHAILPFPPLSASVASLCVHRSNPWYRQHLATVHNNSQEVMLGYSDSGEALTLVFWLLVRSCILSAGAAVAPLPRPGLGRRPTKVLAALPALPWLQHNTFVALRTTLPAPWLQHPPAALCTPVCCRQGRWPACGGLGAVQGAGGPGDGEHPCCMSQHMLFWPPQQPEVTLYAVLVQACGQLRQCGTGGVTAATRSQLPLWLDGFSSLASRSTAHGIALNFSVRCRYASSMALS